jgi:acetylornithine deacetylase/succinyl-diaminopimelate desuccinylase-like protein
MMKSIFQFTIALLASTVCLAQEPTVSRSPDELKAREIFRRVISFRTSVGLHQVPAMTDYLAGEFRAAGFPDADIHVLPLGDTASLVVRYRGDGSGAKPILLMAHMDVVTANREDWQRDPFTLVEENGYFYGRGTYDVKNGVTSLTAAFLRLKSEGFMPTRDLVLMFTGDEETTAYTTQELVHNHHELIDADFALNTDAGVGTLDETTGRPVYYAVETAEKTFADYELTVHNPGGHSAHPRADNAIYELADALKKLQAFRFPVMWDDTTLGFFRGIAALTPGELGTAMANFSRNPHDPKAAAVLSASPAYVGMIRTTCVPTLLRGGHADNALPQSATVTINCRIYPGVDPAAVQATLQGTVGPKVEIAPIGPLSWSDASPLREDVLSAITRAVHARHPGIPVIPNQASGASDSVFTRPIGIPSYGASESFIKDSDDFSHGLNERLPVQSFYDGLEYWHVLLKDLGGPAH